MLIESALTKRHSEACRADRLVAVGPRPPCVVGVELPSFAAHAIQKYATVVGPNSECVHRLSVFTGRRDARFGRAQSPFAAPLKATADQPSENRIAFSQQLLYQLRITLFRRDDTIKRNDEEATPNRWIVAA